VYSKKVILFSITFVVGIICLILILNSSICADCGVRQPIKTAKLQLQQFKSALEEYRSICDRYPSDADGLDVLANPINCMGKSGAQLIKNLTLDPWDRKWNYVNENGGFKVMTLGSDGTFGGEGSNIDLIITNRDSP